MVQKSFIPGSFLPFVLEKLATLGLEQEAILLLDNHAAHPDKKDLVRKVCEIVAMYLPSNVTSLI